MGRREITQRRRTRETERGKSKSTTSIWKGHGSTKERDGRCQKTTRRKRMLCRGEAKKIRRRRIIEERWTSTNGRRTKTRRGMTTIARRRRRRMPFSRGMP